MSLVVLFFVSSHRSSHRPSRADLSLRWRIQWKWSTSVERSSGRPRRHRDDEMPWELLCFFSPPFFWGKMTNANFMTEKLLVGESLSLLVGWVKTVQGDGTAAAPKRSRPSLMSRSHCMSNWQGWWNAQKQQPTNVVNRKPCKPNKKRARKHSSIHQHQNGHFKHHSSCFFSMVKTRCIRFGMNFWDQSRDFHEENKWDELLGEEKHHKDLGESPPKNMVFFLDPVLDGKKQIGV